MDAKVKRNREKDGIAWKRGEVNEELRCHADYSIVHIVDVQAM